MISVEKALSLVLENLPSRSAEEVELRDAFGRVLAEDIVSPADFPPFHRSAMDGYAVRSEDAKLAPVVLTMKGISRAGCGYAAPLQEGQAVAIMTGAPVPEGADTVQALEQVLLSDDGTTVTLLKPVWPGENITSLGAEVRRGEVVLAREQFLGPPEVAVLSTLGRLRISVFRRPRVAILSTGDELVEPDQIPQSDQIRNSNAYSLQCQVRQLGVLPEYLGIAGDDEASLRSGIHRGLERDILIITGGVSVGAYDKVKDIFKASGLEIVFSKVAMRPGKPTVFARKGDKLIFGLPGNPISTFVSFENFVRPALGRLCGFKKPELPRITGILTKEIKQTTGRTSFLPAQVSWESNGWRICPLPYQGSGDIFGFSLCNAMIIFPSDRSQLNEGDDVEALLLPDYFSRH
jgi:molybdopterin molybdotransferase